MPTNKPEVVLPELPAPSAWAMTDYQPEANTQFTMREDAAEHYASVGLQVEPLYTADQLRAYGQACIDTLTRPVAGDFVMVPRELTDEMAEAAWDSDAADYVGEHKRIHSLTLAWNAMLSAAHQQHGQEVVAGWSRELLKDLHERLVRSGISDHLDGGSNKAADRAYIKAAITEAYGLIADLLVTTHSESQQPAEAVAEYQYRKPGAHDDSWHRMTREEYEASLATGHCCGIASWTKNFELRKLYTTPNPAQQAEVAAVDFDGTDSEVLREFIRLCREVKPVGQWPGEQVCAAIERSMANEKPFRFIAEADMAPERGHNGRGGDADRLLSGPRRSPPPAIDTKQAEAVTVDEAWADFAGVYLGDDEGEATLDTVRLCRMAFDAGQRAAPPPAIDIGKLRELVERWRVSEREADTQHRKQTGYEIDFSDRARSETYERCADELAALIGDGGEKGNG